MQMDQLQGLKGAPVYDASGDQIGKVEEIFADVDSGSPEWIGLGTGFFGTKRVLVPVVGVRPSATALRCRTRRTT
jgi:sporulation protein YlmC with PRC-barrel domain